MGNVQQLISAPSLRQSESILQSLNRDTVVQMWQAEARMSRGRYWLCLLLC